MSETITIQQLIYEIPFTKLLKYFNYESIIKSSNYYKYVNYNNADTAILYYPKNKDQLHIINQHFVRQNKIDFFFNNIVSLDKEEIEHVIKQCSTIEDHDSTRSITSEFSDNDIITLFLDIIKLDHYIDDSFDHNMFLTPPFQNKFFLHSPTDQPCIVLFNNSRISNLITFSKDNFNYHYPDNNAYWTSDFDTKMAKQIIVAYNPYNFNTFFSENNPYDYVSLVLHPQIDFYVFEHILKFKNDSNILKDFLVLIGHSKKELLGIFNLTIQFILHNKKEDYHFFYNYSSERITFYFRDSINNPDPLNITNLQSLIMSGLNDEINLDNKEISGSIYDNLKYNYNKSSSPSKYNTLNFPIQKEFITNLIDKLFKYENLYNPFIIKFIDNTAPTKIKYESKDTAEVSQNSF